MADTFGRYLSVPCSLPEASREEARSPQPRELASDPGGTACDVSSVCHHTNGPTAMVAWMRFSVLQMSPFPDCARSWIKAGVLCEESGPGTLLPLHAVSVQGIASHSHQLLTAEFTLSKLALSSSNLQAMWCRQETRACIAETPTTRTQSSGSAARNVSSGRRMPRAQLDRIRYLDVHCL
eukprot:1669928-Rhodomonas_salina.2